MSINKQRYSNYRKCKQMSAELSLFKGHSPNSILFMCFLYLIYMHLSAAMPHIRSDSYKSFRRHQNVNGAACLRMLHPQKQIFWYVTEHKSNASYNGNIVNDLIMHDSTSYFELLSRYFVGNQ